MLGLVMNLSSIPLKLRGKSATPLLNDKVKLVNSCVKSDLDLKNCESKVVVSDIGCLFRGRQLTLTSSIPT